MCGIVGMVSQYQTGFWNQHSSIFTNMLVCDSVRGPDSTGVFGVKKSGNVKYLKTKGNPFEMVELSEYKKFKDGIYSDFSMVVGHNRKATIGKISDETAHPFQEGNLILVHNGTLFNHKSLTKQEVEVDSQAIVHSFVENGYKESLKEIDGAFALVWYDADDKLLRLVRNDKRPLGLVETDSAWYFASEPGMLAWLLSRENIKPKQLVPCEPGVVYSFSNDKRAIYEEEKVELYKPKSYHTVDTQKSFPVIQTNNQTKKEPEEKHEEAGVGGTYSHQFRPFETITVVIEDFQPYTTPSTVGSKEYIGFFRGYWFLNSETQVMVYATQEEYDAFTESGEDPAVYTCTVMRSLGINEGNSSRVWANNMETYIPVYDISGKEVLVDEFQMTDKKCRQCGGIVNWNFITTSRFKFKNPKKHRLVCHECCAKHPNRVH